MTRAIRPVSDAAIAGASALLVGLILGVGGVALMIAILSTDQPALQTATALVLLAAGAIDMGTAGGIRHQRTRSMVLSAAATTILLTYLGVALKDFGELFWVNVALLVLLIAVRSRTDGQTPRPAA